LVKAVAIPSAAQVKECKGMSPQSTDLQAVVARARDGQPTAIAELYASYGDAVRRYCYVRLNDLEVAQDCVQEVFLRIWRGIKTFEYRGDASFTAWMYTIANNVLISHARKHKSIQQVPLTPELNLADTRHADTARTIVDRLTLREAIGQLTLEQQHVITLKFFVGMSNIEIATALGRTEGAVKALQHRAINRLQHILNHEDALMIADVAIGEAAA
jgi:RNA polymerase sigma-70 factor (ECF subfamily)